jgi:TPR repeat protein
MPDEHKLPAQIPARALAPAEQSGSLVARGLEAIKNRQARVVSLTAEADPETSFRNGVEADARGAFAEAVNWYRKAANRGHSGAQLNLGRMYDTGRGVPQDDPEAAKWFCLAAERGDAEAQFNLGRLYDEGRGVPQDHAEELKWVSQGCRPGLRRRSIQSGCHV